VQLKYPELAVGANHVSLIEAQVNYADFDACERRILAHVRPPKGSDVRDLEWRPIDPSVDNLVRTLTKNWPADSTDLYWWRTSLREPIVTPNLDPLEVAAWRWVVGDIRAEDLPDLATNALVRGLDGPTLRALAGENRDDAQSLRDLFALALEELNYPLLDQDSAQWQLIRLTARAIVAGSVDPGDGANQIWRRSLHVAEEGDLRVFVGLASQLEDHPSSAATLNEAILVAAADLLARAEPRRWIQVRASVDVSPLGHHDPDGYRVIEIQSEPITNDLMSELKAWNDDFHSVLDGWPARGGFRSEANAEAFVGRGRELAARLQTELGPTHHVEYYAEPIRPPGVKLSRK
jgi:Cysteine-rich CPCC